VPMIIEARNLVKKYNNYTVLKNLNFTINNGEITVIVGKSGCGKSTLLKVLSTIDINETSGEIIFGDINLLKLSKKKRAEFRNRNIGFIFQDYKLMNELSVLQNCMIPLLMNNRSYSKAKELAEKFINEFFPEKGDFIKNIKPFFLSGGEQQRVGIIRAIIHQPKLILADEPTGNLDNETKKIVIKHIKSLKTFDRAIVIVTHDEEIVNKLGDRVLKFENLTGK